jgi:hypothetical protein
MTDLNKNIQVNRGLELFLNGGKRKQPKTCHINVNKVVSFLKREVTIKFEFSLNIRKNK